jgi:wee1-like protein kinase
MLFNTQGDASMGDAPSQIEPTPSGQLSDPFKNMCIASQQPIGAPGGATQRPPVPLFSQTVPTTYQFNGPAPVADGPDVPCSQLDYLGTQDFNTPADLFDLEYDPGAPAARQRSPAQLSPNRIKRARKSDGEEAPAMSLPSLGVPPGPPGRVIGNNPYGNNPPAPRRQITRVQSPPCYRSMFQQDNENEQTSFKSWRHPRPAPPSAPSGPSFSRFRTEFKELGCIGQGSFSKVFRARHRIDAMLYAVKRTIKEVTPEQPEFLQFLQEAQVLGRLEPHPNVVRYYSSWTEPGFEGGERLYTQLELCDVALDTHIELGDRITEAEIVKLARQIASALQHLHAHGVAHMDLKPANVYLKYKEEENDEDSTMHAEPVYKLGDFGQATKLQIGSTGEAMVNEGDCRYLPLEVMNSNYSALDKADMFSLGAMMFELASGRELPSGGQTYEDLRKGRVPLLPTATASFMKLIRALLSPDPKDRPSAAKVLQMAPIGKRPSSATSGGGVLQPAGGQENSISATAAMKA